MAEPHAAHDPDDDDFARTFTAPPTPRAERDWDRPYADLDTAQLVKAMSAGLTHRVMPGAFPCPPGVARDFASMSLVGCARVLLERRGFTGLSKDAIAARSLRVDGTRSAPEGYLVTDDFVSVLLNLARATLTAGYQVAPRTFTSWCRATTLQDFRQTWRISLGAGPQLQPVPQHGEFTRAPLPSRAESIQLQTFGKIIAFTRQAMVNDDLGMLARIPQMFGFSAASMEGDMVYNLLLANPLMSDGNPVFCAQHGNLATASPIDVAGMEAARLLMRTQTSPEGLVLNLEPKFLIVGPRKEVEALQLTASDRRPDHARHRDPGGAQVGRGRRGLADHRPALVLGGDRRCRSIRSNTPRWPGRARDRSSTRATVSTSTGSSSARVKISPRQSWTGEA